jgi:drug/metabolite transporter (DMT)-like permease
VNKQLKLSYWLLFLGAIAIGWSAIFVKLAHIDGVTSAFYRMAIASIFLIPIWLLKFRTVYSLQYICITLLGGVLFGFDLFFWNTSIMSSPSAISTVLANFAPIWVTIGSYFIFKEKITFSFLIGAIIALLGIVTIIGFQNLIHLQINKGNTYALITSIFYALFILTTFKARTIVDTFTFLTLSSLSGAVTLAILAFFTNHSISYKQVDNWWPLIGLGLFSHVVGWYAINYALGFISSKVASVSLLSQAIWTAIFAIPVLNEYLTIEECFGGLLILIGIAIVYIFKNK